MATNTERNEEQHSNLRANQVILPVKEPVGLEAAVKLSNHIPDLVQEHSWSVHKAVDRHHRNWADIQK